MDRIIWNSDYDVGGGKSNDQDDQQKNQSSILCQKSQFWANVILARFSQYFSLHSSRSPLQCAMINSSKIKNETPYHDQYCDKNLNLSKYFLCYSGSVLPIRLSLLSSRSPSQCQIYWVQFSVNYFVTLGKLWEQANE